jgi:hypothetical protein
MHTVLAFMTLCKDYRLPGATPPERSRPAGPSDEQQEYVLLKYTSMPRKQQVGGAKKEQGVLPEQLGIVGGLVGGGGGCAASNS